MTHPKRDLIALAVTLWLIALAASARAAEPDATRVKGANRIDVYNVRWWGTEGSERDRPIYRVAAIDNGRLELRHIIVKGRPLENYVLPYWPIRSCLTIVNRPAELAHQPEVTLSQGGKARTVSLVVHEGFDLAGVGDTDVLKVTNRGAGGPVLIEHALALAERSSVIHVAARITNTSGKPIEDVTQHVHYQQQFNWTDLLASQGEDYEAVEPGSASDAKAFHAYSDGMQRGYELVAGDQCRLSYKRSKELNHWHVTLSGKTVALASGESTTMRYTVRAVERCLTKPTPSEPSPIPDPTKLPFRRVTPKTLKTAPIRQEGRVMLPQVVAGLKRPKIRGLNLRAGFPQALKDLETLKDWGCNLVITQLGKPEHTRQIIQRGHELGIQMFLAGRGRWMQGPPRFDAYYDKPLPPAQQADAHGQDEDHYYWFGHQPTRDFTADVGKPMARATQEHRVRYWARCFADRWRGVLSTVRKHAPEGDIWFYMPTPGVAHIDPLDYYDLFLGEVAKLGKPLTVFPFYYGVEYNQAEYMIRRWKDAGAHRVAFLPMRGFMARPSQFIRAITAARRGQADGTCGFAFPVGAEKSGNNWQWQSVMLAALANFPTPELDAYCLMEEPADMVEALASCDVTIAATDADVTKLLKRLGELLPGRVGTNRSAANDSRGGDSDAQASSRKTLTVLVGSATMMSSVQWPVDMDALDLPPGKGCIQMQPGRTIGLFGDSKGLSHAMTLLERFARLARAERDGPK